VVNPEGVTLTKWLRSQIEAEPYWFHRMELPGGLVTPGWSDPKVDKLPYFGLPDDMSGLRVLDIGHAEGFFSFEAERRGAAEVVALDRSPDHARKFNICRTALGSRVRSQIASVYDISPERFGTFDLVMFFGVLYHLRHPLLALEKIQAVCSGTLLMQTAICADTSDTPMAEFHPHGIESGPPDNRVCDTTCVWFPSPACCIGMLDHLGFKGPERISTDAPVGGVFRAKAATPTKGQPPLPEKNMWL